jgi:PAS domain S-box-containing protein
MNKHLLEFESENNINYLDENALAVINDELIIIYANKMFTSQFNLEKCNSVKEVDSEPDLISIIERLSLNNYDNISLEIFCKKDTQFEGNLFNVFIEKLNIMESEFYFLLFKSLKENQRIERKINSLYNTIEQGDIPVILINKLGKITYISQSFEGILNCNIDSFFQSSFYTAFGDFLDEDDVCSIENSLRENLHWSKIINLSNGIDKYYELKLKPLSKKKNTSDNYILTAVDVTSLIQKNGIIKKSEIQLRSIINNISDLLLVVIKKENTFLFDNANENFCNIFDIIRHKSYRKNIFEIFDNEFLNGLLNSFEHIDVKNKDYKEFPFTKNGRNYSARISSIINIYEDEKTYITSLRDVTEQIEFQEQLKRAYEKEIHLNNLKTIFLENMSHEIRTPFNAIVGYSDIINECLQSGDVEEIKELSISVKDVLHRILNLFTDIVEVSQIESGDISIEKEIINCYSVLNSVYNKKLEEAELKNLNFIIEKPDEPVYFEADWIKFDKIITALIDNCIKNTDAGEIIISAIKINSEIEITIKDTGKGFDEIEIPRLLKPFEQNENGYTRSNQGAGLGLAIASKLTTLLGGKFEIRSTINKGTNVKLTFPVENTYPFQNPIRVKNS